MLNAVVSIAKEGRGVCRFDGVGGNYFLVPITSHRGCTNSGRSSWVSMCFYFGSYSLRLLCLGHISRTSVCGEDDSSF